MSLLLYCALTAHPHRLAEFFFHLAAFTQRSHRAVAAFNAFSWRFFFVHWRLYRASTAFLVHCQPDHENCCSVANDVVFSNQVVDEYVKSSICEYIPEPIKGRNWNSCHFVPLFPHVF